MNMQAIVEAIENYTSSYNSFINSTDPADKDHAELFRLAAITMREARIVVVEGGQLIPEEAIEFYRNACTEYLATGRLLDDSGEAMALSRAVFRREYEETDRKRLAGGLKSDGKKTTRKNPVPFEPTADPIPVLRVPIHANPEIVEMVADRMTKILA